VAGKNPQELPSRVSACADNSYIDHIPIPSSERKKGGKARRPSPPVSAQFDEFTAC
jgi:hypothetical protein